MSISLNDHESRIAALESRKLKRIIVWDNGTMVLNPYTFDLLELQYGDAVGDCKSSIVSSQALKEMGGYYSCITIDNNSGGSQYIAIEGALTKITESTVKIVYPWINVSNGSGIHAYNSDSYTSLIKIYGLTWGGGINLGTLLQRLLVYIKTYSKLFHLQFLEVK